MSVSEPASASNEEIDSHSKHGPGAWRVRIFDRLSGVGAMLIGALMLYGAWEIRLGESLLRDTLTVGAPLVLLAAAVLRRAPYRLRAYSFLIALFAIEFLAASRYGYGVGTILIALIGVGLSALLLGMRWAIAGWGLSTTILLGTALSIHMGWLAPAFDPTSVDPSNLPGAVRISLTYGVCSALLALGVYAVVERLSASLRDTRQALALATSARNERARAEAEKRAAEARFRSVVEHAPDSIAIVDRSHRVLFANHQSQDRLDPTGRLAEELVVPEHAERVRKGVERVFAHGEPVSYDVQVADELRGPVWYSSRVGPIVERGQVERAIVVTSDISGRLDLEEQLLQAQKLEAVGQLTGGVAHDFNNLLTVILGNLQLVAGSLAPDDPAQAFVENARAAARRGSSLTHRLLAFARKQALQPRVLDVGDLVSGMDDLLRRTLGETVDIQTRRAEGLWKCEVDPTQLENVILNLAINARDAMPGGGELTIETANVTVDADSPQARQGARPGAYVMLAISDAGSGMNREVLEHAFEPFFTTKGLGRGSGLGLSMVYGFVRQSGGDVQIESAPGEGTCVRVYLPRTRDGEMQVRGRIAPPPEAAGPGPRGSGELILVVEDDEAVRSLTVNLLQRSGYATAQAEDGPDALELLSRRPDVALVFTDVVLPGGMGGAALARAIQERRPGLPVLFTSGYTENAIGLRGRLPPGIELVSKPFTQATLAERIHGTLRAARTRPVRVSEGS